MGPTLTLIATLYALSPVCSSTVAPGTFGATRSTSRTASQTDSIGASTSKRFSNRIVLLLLLCPVPADGLDDGAERRDAVPADELVDVGQGGRHASGDGGEAARREARVHPHDLVREP